MLLTEQGKNVIETLIPALHGILFVRAIALVSPKLKCDSLL